MFLSLPLLFPPCICLFWSVLLGVRWKEYRRAQRMAAIGLFLLAVGIFGCYYVLESYWDIRLNEQLSLTQILAVSLPAIGICYGVGFYFSRWPEPTPAETPEPPTEEAVEELTETAEPAAKSYEKLLPEFNRLMEEEKIFLQKNLRREDFAERMKTNRTYIAQLIREEYQCGFSEFINRRRITYACDLLRQHPEIPQDQLATKSGFTNISTFSRTFKQYTGTTFRQWQKNIPE
ncbi:helix-turn-helix domain-containing protein [Parabacteroides sp. PF5-6]|uniref:helix-turn-helix domain-containing protein n=1 Tax=Parabacteroides sp. PF5-6 TaxID=1742403 RepID=UPI00240650C9|nr:helix-turn-helix domain-containing protein [Parabacteroides sp. PF5-6]MDF9831407.1 AraC-like DNA-binding protein [Parabacteroides sp. PF5-6]